MNVEIPAPVARAPTIEFVHAGELTAQPNPVQWDVKNLIVQRSLVALVGPPASFKTAVALDIAASVATGRPWAGRATRPGPVFYIAGEGNAGISRRLSAWEVHHGVSLASSNLYVSKAGVGFDDQLNAEAVAAEVERLSKAHAVAPVLVVIDTLARNFGEGDENSAADMSRFVENIDRWLRSRFGCSVLIVHHPGHSDIARARGSSAFRAALDTEIFARASQDGLTLECTKSKDAPKFAPIAMQLMSVDLSWHTEDGTPDKSFVLYPRSDEGRADERAGMGENQRRAMDALQELHIERSQSGRSDGGSPAFLMSDWKAKSALSPKRFAETAAALRKRGCIRIEGSYVYLSRVVPNPVRN